jgi:hypothetical protein
VLANVLLRVVATAADSGCGRPVTAYLGPGAVVSTLGAVLAVIAGVFIAVFGFIWYPVRRLIRRLRKHGPAEEEKSAPEKEKSEEA